MSRPHVGNKDLDRLLGDLLSSGDWSVKEKSKHVIVKHKSGSTIAMSRGVNSVKHYTLQSLRQQISRIQNPKEG